MAPYFKQCPRKLLSQIMISSSTWRFSLETRMMKRLWSLCLRLKRQCEVQSQTGRIVGVAAMVVVAMVTFKQLVRSGGVTSGVPLPVAPTLIPTEGELVAVRMTGVCLKLITLKILTSCCVYGSLTYRLE